jgi:hypothetical protein
VKNLPEPLVPADCDLRTHPFMPLDVTRLRDSDLAALESPEACWAAVLLWCASWHQLPAASLPDDDKILANLSGFGRVVKEWMKVKNGALRGWVKCSDGRLYHHAVAEKAITAWNGKLQQAWRTELARIKKHNQRHTQDLIKEPSFDQFLSLRTKVNCPQDNNENTQRQSADVSNVSEEKPNPIERDMEKDIDIKLSNVSENCNLAEQSKNLTHSQKQVSEITQALTSIGMMPFNPTLEDFLKLIEAGATVDEFVHTALEQKGNEDKFNIKYLLGTMTRRRQAAAKSQPLHQGTLPAATSREAGRQVAAASVFTAENTQHLQGNTLKIVEVDHDQRAIAN